MSLLGFLIAGSILQEQQNTQEEIKKLRKQLQEYDWEKMMEDENE